MMAMMQMFMTSMVDGGQNVSKEMMIPLMVRLLDFFELGFLDSIINDNLNC